MSTRPLLRAFVWVAGIGVLSLLLYAAVFGWHTLTAPAVELQLHNTYFVVAPMHLLVMIAAVLAVLGGSLYLLLTRLPVRLAAGLVAVAALVLVYLLGGAIASLASTISSGLGLMQPETGAELPAAALDSRTLLRLLPLLRGLQLGAVVVALLAAYRLGRRTDS